MDESMNVNTETEEKVNEELEKEAEELEKQTEDERKYYLRKPITFEGKEIKEIDISGLFDIRGRDIDEARRLLRLERKQVEEEKLYDSPEFKLAILRIKTGIPEELLAEFHACDYILIQFVVNRFLVSLG